MARPRTNAGCSHRLRAVSWRLTVWLLAGSWGVGAAWAQFPNEPPVAPTPATGSPYATINSATAPNQMPIPPDIATPPAQRPAGASQTPANAGQGLRDADPLGKKLGQETVLEVLIQGHKSVSLAKIQSYIHTRQGRPYDEEMVGEDVRRLDSSHLFVNVCPKTKQVDGGRIVVFEVIERPLLTDVLFIGCKEIGKKTLKKESELKTGDAVDPVMIEGARRKLEEFYHKKGFTRARVTLLEGDKPEDRRAVFLINEGAKQKVWWVDFVGNTIADNGRLRTQIKLKPPMFYLFGGEFDRKSVDEDKDRLLAYYRSLGFFKAYIGVEPTYNEKGNWVTITYVINEGPRFKIRNVSVVGNTKYSNEELMADMKLKGSNYYDQSKAMADRNAIVEKYGSIGYAYADVRADNLLLEQPGQLDLVYNIKEGSRYRVGRINIDIKGECPHTQLYTILNRLSFKPGDIVDMREIHDSERRLRASGLFESNPANGNPPQIALKPPGQGGGDDPDRSQVADRPRRSSRGQSPDPQSNGGWNPPAANRSSSEDETLDVMLQGDYIGSQEPNAQPAAQPAPAQQRSPQSSSPQPGGLQPLGLQTPAQRQPATQASNWLPSSAAERQSPSPRPRQTAALPATPVAQPVVGSMVSLPEMRNGNRPADSQDPLFKSLGEVTKALAEKRRTQPNRIVLTQYTQDNSQTTTAQRSQPRWVDARPAATANSGAASQTTTSSAPSNTLPQNTPQNTQQNATRNATSQNAFGQQAAPVEPTPQYGDPNYRPGPDVTWDAPFIDVLPDGGNQAPLLDIDSSAEEAMTGRISFGVGVNSDAGLVGSAMVDEQNFDWTKLPTSWADIRDGRAFRGAGQRFRLMAAPGTSTSQYSVTFEEPYMFDSRWSNTLNGFYATRIYTEYSEQRLGGRIAFGRMLTHDLSIIGAYRGAKYNITNPIDAALPDLEAVTGRDLALHGFSGTVVYDKRDNRFMATQGYYAEASFEQVLGSFEYSRAEADLRKYFVLHERPDGSGRHVLALTGHAGWTGDDTPIYERYYLGGYQSLRGFSYRGVSPTELGPTTHSLIHVGGDFELFSSIEYTFPITADDMLRAVVFCDGGTVQPVISDWSQKFRVAPGFGLRIAIPAMGAAPIALDFAFPVVSQTGDNREMFSFFLGFTR